MFGRQASPTVSSGAWGRSTTPARLLGGAAIVTLLAAGCAGLNRGAYIEVDITASVCQPKLIGAVDETCVLVRPTGSLVRIYQGADLVAQGNPENGPYRIRLHPGDYRVVASSYLFGVARQAAKVNNGQTTTVRLALNSLTTDAPPAATSGGDLGLG